MKRALSCTTFLFVLALPLLADSNLRIDDVGLHGYVSSPSAVRLTVRNPFPKRQTVHVQLIVAQQYVYPSSASTVSADVNLDGGEQREMELPIVTSGARKVSAKATTASGAVVGQDVYEPKGRQTGHLVVLMCANDNVCRNLQSQIQFSGSIENRADKNRGMTFEAVADPRDHWWAYSACSAIVLAMPVAKLTSLQHDALEDYLRRGGILVLLEKEIDDPRFLSAYRHQPAPPEGEQVSMGTLFRVASLTANSLGDVFAGHNLAVVLARDGLRRGWGNAQWLRIRFATAFDFPRLRWLLAWLAAYLIVVGLLNFALLRRLHRMEWGWVTVVAVALVFAAGFYLSSASRRPKSFRLDNLTFYYLDSQSPLAAADYSLRVSAPERRDLLVSVADPAVFTSTPVRRGEAHSQIWTELNRQGPSEEENFDIQVGPPRRLEVPLLQWSFRDLDLEGLHDFPGTMHFTAPDVLKNDTGQRFLRAVYLDHTANVLYRFSGLAAGAEIHLDTTPSTPIRVKDEKGAWVPGPVYSDESLRDLMASPLLSSTGIGRVFAGFTDGPALPVSLNVAHDRNVHALIVVFLEHP
jgi:hypothetical protein